MNEITTMAMNSRKLAEYCSKYGLKRKVTSSRGRYVILDKNGELGVISCMPSNNGKYLAYKAGVQSGEYFDTHVACPAFHCFETALGHITR